MFSKRILPFVAILAVAGAAVAAEGPKSGPEAETKGTEAKCTGRVAVDQLTVRALPEKTAREMGIIKKGDVVEVLGRQGEWLKIGCPSGIRLWVPATSLKIEGGVGVVDEESVEARAGGAFNMPKIATLKKGENVEVTGHVGTWAKIVPPEGAAAWVYGKYVELTPGSAPPEAGSVASAGKGSKAETPGGRTLTAIADRDAKLAAAKADYEKRQEELDNLEATRQSAFTATGVLSSEEIPGGERRFYLSSGGRRTYTLVGAGMDLRPYVGKRIGIVNGEINYDAGSVTFSKTGQIKVLNIDAKDWYKGYEAHGNAAR